MSAVPVTRTKFLQALSGIAKGRDNADDPTTKLRRALLDFASETPDNLNCAERIEVSTLGAETGLALHGRGVLLSDIAHALENAPMPDALNSPLTKSCESDSLFPAYSGGIGDGDGTATGSAGCADGGLAGYAAVTWTCVL
ncbi:MAG: hypothetical protein V3V97_21890 [Hyphomicrobiaceae bacterium]